MRKILHLAILLTISYLPFSCNNSGKKADAVAASEYIDTIKYEGQNVYLEKIDSAEYSNAMKAYVNIDTLTGNSSDVEQRDTVIYYDIAKETNSHKVTLITLKLQNGDSMQMPFDMVTYTYQGKVTELNSYLLSGNDADGDFYSLIDKKSGKESPLFRSYPFFSPDRKMVCSFDECNGMPPVGTTCVSLCIRPVASSNFGTEWCIPLFKWRSQIVWKDSSTLYLRLEDARYTNGPVYFARLNLPDLKK